jgi:hypothetical protein
MESATLQARLLDNARRYDPAEHHRSLLVPFQDIILLWRVKFMSYEQIAATLTSHGIKVSPAGVGVFCRKNFSKPQIVRERQRLATGSADQSPATAPGLVPPTILGKRGPRIARDNY